MVNLVLLSRCAIVAAHSGRLAHRSTSNRDAASATSRRICASAMPARAAVRLLPTVGRADARAVVEGETEEGVAEERVGSAVDQTVGLEPGARDAQLSGRAGEARAARLRAHPRVLVFQSGAVDWTAARGTGRGPERAEPRDRQTGRWLELRDHAVEPGRAAAVHGGAREDASLPRTDGRTVRARRT